jgi:hypothetical protein
MEGLREVSAYAPADAAPALAPLTDDALADLRTPFTVGGRDGIPGVLIGLAAALLVVLLVGVGYALGTRRSTVRAATTAW